MLLFWIRTVEHEQLAEAIMEPASIATPIMVFGSNTQGRHGRGCAAFAHRWCGAAYGIGEGPTGSAYAIPTKDAGLRVLPLDRIHAATARFLTYAGEHLAQTFEVTRIGCGLAGYRDTDIAPLFFSAPPNCILPYTWQRLRNPRTIPRVIIAGSRDFNDYATLERRVTAWTRNLGYFEVVSGGAHGADALGERFARDHGWPVVSVPAQWQRYGRAAGMIRNQRMSWLASHLVAFWIAQSKGTANMIETARADRLPVKVLRCARLAV